MAKMIKSIMFSCKPDQTRSALSLSTHLSTHRERLTSKTVSRSVTMAEHNHRQDTDKEQHPVRPALPACLAVGRAAVPPLLASSEELAREKLLRTGGRLFRAGVGMGLVLLLCAAATAPARAETRRLCDRRVTFDVVQPVGVPANLTILSGIWKGTVIMAGGSEMCLSIVVKEVFADGRVHLLLTWNLAMGGRDDINNYIGMGEALHWPNKVENGEIRIDSRTQYNGRHYYYGMKAPTDSNPDTMEGQWMTDSHPQPVLLYREKKP